jgi:hypothetical protein
VSNGSSIQGLGLVSTPPPLPANLPGLPPNFDSIPLAKTNFFPLDELQAMGGYNRQLLLPDDLIPTLNMPYAWTHDGVPKVHRSQKDGALNVFQTNAGGGSLSSSGFHGTAASQAISSGINGSVTDVATTLGQKVLGVSVTAFADDMGGNANFGAVIDFFDDVYPTVHIGVMLFTTLSVIQTFYLAFPIAFDPGASSFNTSCAVGISPQNGSVVASVCHYVTP